jgi:prepilin peptidase CpaA
MSDAYHLAAFAVATPLMLLTIYFDLKQMRIPNKLTLTVVAAFLLVGGVFLEPTELAFRVLAGLLVLTIGFILYNFGRIGGGDIKMLAAIAPFVPVTDAPVVMMLLSALLLIGLGGILIARRLVPATVAANWKALDRKSSYPMGLSIAAAMIVYLAANALP